MKKNYWLALGTLIATSAVAQVQTNTSSTALPAIPAPAIATPAPAPEVVATNKSEPKAEKKSEAVKHKKKAVAKKTVVRKLEEPTVTLVAGPATVTSENLNVRGQAGLKGEAVGKLKKGDAVTVLAQINLDKHAADEPAQWAKIALPEGVKVWVNKRFIDAANKTVSAKKLNLRAGPGENYSVLGLIERGEAVHEITTKGDWTQIEAPTNAFAFVAAMYLRQEAMPAAPAVETAPPVAEMPPTTNNVAEAQPIVTQPAAPATTQPPVTEPTVTAAVPAAPPAEANVPPPPRVVTHEGFVRPSISVVAPTYFELYDKTTGNTVDYLYSTTKSLDLSRYNGFQIIVTGEEGLDPRWQNTPVLTVQKIYVVSGKAPVRPAKFTSPRASGQ